MESLPMEIKSTILARLPVKDVTRFKLVNKPWYAFISSLYFAQIHLNNNNSLHYHDDRIIIFINKDDGCLNFTDVEDYCTSLNPKKINFNYSLYKFKSIIGSCNGLVLCTCFVNDYEGLNLVLVNPTTLQHKLISKIEPYEYSSNNSCYGIGYDHNNNDYKIVKIMPRKSENGEKFYQVAVYSLNCDTWKFIDQDCLCDGEFSNQFGALINKHILHWAFYRPQSRVILSFDVCTEQWSEMPLPHGNKYIHIPRMPKAHLRGVDGRLCLVNHELNYEVFMMEKYGVEDSWVNFCHGYKFPLLYSKSGDEILLWSMPCRSYWLSSANKADDLLVVKYPDGSFWSRQKIIREVEIDNTLFTSCDGAPSVCIRSLVQLPLDKND